jgi:tRNA A-37 threonylcarbamoyl transferase component Bud32
MGMMATDRDDDLGLGSTLDSGPDHGDPSSATLTELAAGALPVVAPGRYKVEGELGRGGLGRVLRARDRVLDRPVAIKELLEPTAGASTRFVREALITARLQHPAIVPVHDAARWSGDRVFYAMKLVAGRPLSEAIAAGRTPRERLALLPSVIAVADAIAYAHSEGVIHRDLKPANVLVGDFGETVVIDWGLAKDLSTAVEPTPADDGPYRRAVAADATAAGSMLGTLAYMPPEQIDGSGVDARADVYALGAMLYHVLGGVAPHTGDSFQAVVGRILAGERTPLAQLAPDLPSDLHAIVNRAMAVDPAERYPSARELAEDLRRFQAGRLVVAHRYTWSERVRRWLGRHRAVAGVVAAATLVLGAYGAWSVQRIVEESRRADRERDAAVRAADAAERERVRAEAAAGEAAAERDRSEAQRQEAIALLTRVVNAAAHFEVDSVDLGRSREVIALALGGIRDAGYQGKIRLEGHLGRWSVVAGWEDAPRPCPDRPGVACELYPGTEEYALVLGDRLTGTLKKVAREVGMDDVETVSYGYERPLTAPRDESPAEINRAAEINNRVELVLDAMQAR